VSYKSHKFPASKRHDYDDVFGKFFAPLPTELDFSVLKSLKVIPTKLFKWGVGLGRTSILISKK